MKKIRVFISSVQSEFVEERQMLFDYLISDALLGMFFDPFLFEKLPAVAQSTSSVYLEEVGRCDLFIGIFGKEYGSENNKGVSPTEQEFDYAGKLSKKRLIFVSSHAPSDRNPKALALIKKAENAIVRKQFSSAHELKASVYASLIRHLEEMEYIRTVPFDMAINKEATMDDLSVSKIRDFVALARLKRGFPLTAEKTPETILTHLNLLKGDKVTNAAILLFGKEPQRFFMASEVKCAHFHGRTITKPIPSYQVYKGDVFQLVDQAVDFVLSKINMAVGTRDENVQVAINYEIPRAAVAEAIVNAIAHRDYTSNGSVQVMLFKDRLEVWNPGQLPSELTIAKLREPHNSVPVNLLLAEPMYFAGYIERMGTGTGDIIQWCREAGIEKDPVFEQDEIFKTIIWKKDEIDQASDQVSDQVTVQPTVQVNYPDTEGVNVVGAVQPTVQPTVQVDANLNAEEKEYIKRVVLAITDGDKRSDIQNTLGLKHRASFVENYLNPALQYGYIEMMFPDNPNHPQQRYTLTEKGTRLKKTKKFI